MAELRMEAIGQVTAFFVQPSVAVVALSAPLKLGETIYVKGHTTDFQDVVRSMQIDHASVQEAAAGAVVGLQVASRCRKHDVVYKLAT